MKIRHANQQTGCFPPRGRAGMTLVEVLIALAISVMIVAGMVTGYIFSTTSVIKAELAHAANAKAMERLEQTRSAQWDPYNSSITNQLVATTNFPDEVVNLDLPGTNTAGTAATIRTTIAQISINPPLCAVHVDCIWQFQGGGVITNSVETIRAPSQ
jgi:prepilin-type N-terminal cleavage/methylation domain-containing protein